jgi:hypothetical protein
MLLVCERDHAAGCKQIELFAVLEEVTEVQIERLQRLFDGFLYAVCRIHTSEQYISVA